MLSQLRENPQQIPNPSRDDLMRMLCDALASLEIDCSKALKNNFVLNALDASVDFLVSEKLYELVGAEMIAFRESLTKSTPPSSLKELIKTITPPRGVKVKSPTAGASPLDEGNELFDCYGGEIEDDEEIVPPNVELSDEDDELAPHSSEQASSVATSIGSRFQDSFGAPVLSELASEESLKRDCLFLEEIKSVLEKHNRTSTLFVLFMCQFRATYSRARSSLKRRVSTNSNLVQQLLDDKSCGTPKPNNDERRENSDDEITPKPTEPETPNPTEPNPTEPETSNPAKPMSL